MTPPTIAPTRFRWTDEENVGDCSGVDGENEPGEPDGEGDDDTDDDDDEDAEGDNDEDFEDARAAFGVGEKDECEDGDEARGSVRGGGTGSPNAFCRNASKDCSAVGFTANTIPSPQCTSGLIFIIIR